MPFLKVVQGRIIHFATHVYRIHVWEAFHEHFEVYSFAFIVEVMCDDHNNSCWSCLPLVENTKISRYNTIEVFYMLFPKLFIDFFTNVRHSCWCFEVCTCMRQITSSLRCDLSIRTLAYLVVRMLKTSILDLGFQGIGHVLSLVSCAKTIHLVLQTWQPLIQSHHNSKQPLERILPTYPIAWRMFKTLLLVISITLHSHGSLNIAKPHGNINVLKRMWRLRI